MPKEKKKPIFASQLTSKIAILNQRMWNQPRPQCSLLPC